MTLRQLLERPASLPTATAWYLADLGQTLGKQELFTRQSPQKLKVLREHALIESAVSSNRIEGVEVDQNRIGTIIFGKKLLRDRDEEEVRGYRNALNLIHERAGKLSFSEESVKRLHSLSRGGIGDAGQYKLRDSDIIEKHPDGRQSVRFRTVPAEQTPPFMAKFIDLANRAFQERCALLLLIVAACNLDILCIHPFRDGYGRVSRLLFLLQCYHQSVQVGRYISLERLIEQNKERYYETLKLSSQGWHEGKHDPWPYINFLLYTLLDAYKELERRVGETASPRGSKTDLVMAAIDGRNGPFRVADLQQQRPGVGIDLIRRILKDLQKSNQVKCAVRGRNSQWSKTDKWKLGTEK